MRADAMHTPIVAKLNRPGAAWRAASALVLAAVLTGCGTPSNQSDTSSYLILRSLTATPGGSTTGSGDSGSSGSTGTPTLASDVLTLGVTYADTAEASFQLAFKDPGTAPTPVNFITIQRYHVQYLSNDGQQVPAAFDGSASFTVTGTVTSSGPFILVPASAKSVAPLLQLAGTGGTKSIPATAQVTFYGADQNGKAISITGSIGVTFGDWIDPGVTPTTPVASFTVSPSAGLRTGQTANFDASASVVPPGRTVQSYTWDFGDSTPLVSTPAAQIQHVYNNPGSVTIVLTVKDSAGQSYSTAKTISIQ
jgi:hypothetical protein